MHYSVRKFGHNEDRGAANREGSHRKREARVSERHGKEGGVVEIGGRALVTRRGQVGLTWNFCPAGQGSQEQGGHSSLGINCLFRCQPNVSRKGQSKLFKFASNESYSTLLMTC